MVKAIDYYDPTLVPQYLKIKKDDKSTTFQSID